MNDRTTKPRPEVEILQRTRRIETRLTQTMIALGIPTDSNKPTFDPGNIQGAATVVLPSRHTSFAEVVAAIPDTFRGPVSVVVGGDKLGVLDRTL